MPHKLKKYLVFIWPQYEPGGGMNDFSDSFEELEQAQIHLNTYQYTTGDVPQGHVTNRDTGQMLLTRG